MTPNGPHHPVPPLRSPDLGPSFPSHHCRYSLSLNPPTQSHPSPDHGPLSTVHHHHTSLSPSLITYYFENSPPNWNAKELRLLFSRIASINNVYVSLHLNKLGRHFGFVTVKNIPTLSHLLQWFNSFWIGSYKLRFNIAKHQRPHPPQTPKPESAILQSQTSAQY